MLDGSATVMIDGEPVSSIARPSCASAGAAGASWSPGRRVGASSSSAAAPAPLRRPPFSETGAPDSAERAGPAGA